MQVNSLSFFLSFAFLVLFSTMHVNAAKDSPKIDVSGNIANTVCGVLNILFNPHDKPTLVNNGAVIASNIAAIIQQLAKVIDLQELANLDDQQATELIYKKMLELNIHKSICDAIVKQGVLERL